MKMKKSKRIAVAVDSEMGNKSKVSRHFGRCRAFVFVTAIDNKIDTYTTVENPHYYDQTPARVPAFIKSQGADTIITEDMAPRATKMFNNVGIEVATGTGGQLADVLDEYLQGKEKNVVPRVDNRLEGYPRNTASV